MTPQEYRAQASDKLDAAAAALALNTDEGDATAKTLEAEAAKLTERADTLEAIEARSAKLNVADDRRPGAARATSAEAESADEDGETRSAEESAYRSLVYMRARPEERAILKTTDATSAGNLIPTTYATKIIEIASKVGPMVNPEVVNHFSTTTGADFVIPRGDDTDGTAYIVAEGTDAGDTDFGFDRVTFKALEYSTGMVTITNPMLQDDAYDLMGYVERSFGTRLGKLLNDHYTNGNGSTQPEGLVTGLTAANAVVESVSNTAIVWGDMLNAEEALDEQYHADAVWMLNRRDFQALRKVAASDGSPVIFQGNYSQAAPITILGRRYVINNALANGTMVLGDLKQAYGARTASGLTIATANELYIKKNAKGVIGFGRFDGRVTNPAAAVILKKKA